MAGWFGRFPARVEIREDRYLLIPDPPGLSVKVRGARALATDNSRSYAEWLSEMWLSETIGPAYGEGHHSVSPVPALQQP